MANVDFGLEKGEGRKIEPLALWPSRDEYIRQMGTFLVSNRPVAEKRLRDVSFFIEGEIPDMATLVLRGQFAFGFVSAITRLSEKKKTNLIWEIGLPQKTNAITIPEIMHGDKQVLGVDSLLELLKTNEGLPWLREIKIHMNIERLVVDAVRQANRYYGLALELDKDDVEGAKKIRGEILDKAGIEVEAVVVEEVAHALFFISVFGSRHKLFPWLEEHRGYNPHLPGDEKVIKIDTIDEAEVRRANYFNKRVEIKARV